MRHVVDSSVAFKWVVEELDADKAIQLREAYRASVHDLLAPDVFPPELAHALTRAERQGRLVDATSFWTDVMSTAPRLHASLTLMPRALQIAKQVRIGVYDCIYVALAEREGCEFVTADTRLLNNLRRMFPFIKSLAVI
jgi:predicted nucleic acid-binding protein